MDKLQIHLSLVDFEILLVSISEYMLLFQSYHPAASGEAGFGLDGATVLAFEATS